jgi:hypothetical protein
MVLEVVGDSIGMYMILWLLARIHAMLYNGPIVSSPFNESPAQLVASLGCAALAGSKTTCCSRHEAHVLLTDRAALHFTIGQLATGW